MHEVSPFWLLRRTSCPLYERLCNAVAFPEVHAVLFGSVVLFNVNMIPRLLRNSHNFDVGCICCIDLLETITSYAVAYSGGCRSDDIRPSRPSRHPQRRVFLSTSLTLDELHKLHKLSLPSDVNLSSSTSSITR